MKLSGFWIWQLWSISSGMLIGVFALLLGHSCYFCEAPLSMVLPHLFCAVLCSADLLLQKCLTRCWAVSQFCSDFRLCSYNTVDIINSMILNMPWIHRMVVYTFQACICQMLQIILSRWVWQIKDEQGNFKTENFSELRHVAFNITEQNGNADGEKPATTAPFR